MSSTVMNQAALISAGKRVPADKPSVVQRLGGITRMAARIILSPLRLFLSVRRSMTGASVTLLLIGIVTLNIVWGYPWSGMFSACASLMFVGWAINRAMRPNLGIDFSLPSSSPAGQAFTVVSHVKNRSRLPAMDLGVAFASTRPRRTRRGTAADRRGFRCMTSSHWLTLVPPSGRVDLSGSVVFDRRGVHRLPDVLVTSMFPFHLFKSSRRYVSDIEIAITPRLMIGDEDAVAGGMLDTLGGWSHKLLSGDALDYTGSREYEVGMPVRRWDFSSWARLGRPIVREFQSPSIQVVTLVVDTATDDPSVASGDEPIMERVLSLAATAVTLLNRKMIRTGLYVTSESVSQVIPDVHAQTPPDVESLLVRLARAEPASPVESDQRIEEAIQLMGQTPILLLTARDDHPLRHNAPANVMLLRVDPAHQTPPTPASPESFRRAGQA